MAVANSRLPELLALKKALKADEPRVTTLMMFKRKPLARDRSLGRLFRPYNNLIRNGGNSWIAVTGRE